MQDVLISAVIPQAIQTFIEVNPLAGLHPEHSDLPIICTKAGISYIELIGSIVNSALKRCGLIGSAPQKVKEINKSLYHTHNFSHTVKKKTSLKTIAILHQYVPDNASPDEKGCSGSEGRDRRVN